MSVYKRGQVWSYKFRFAGRMIRESAKTGSKTVARAAEAARRRELENGFNDLEDRREERIQILAVVAKSYLEQYKVRHSSHAFAQYALGHVTRHLGNRMLVDFCCATVREYQTSRLKEKAAPKSINEEVGFLLRLLGDRGDFIRVRLRREKALKLRVHNDVGQAYSALQKEQLLQATDVASKDGFSARSPFMRPALVIALNTGMRDAEIRRLTWRQIDFAKGLLTVGRSKSDAGEGRTIPLNSELTQALTSHAQWYRERFGKTDPQWYVFPGRTGKPEKGKKRPYDPTRAITSLKTAWKNVKKRAGVAGRWHDTRHTLITELAESGAGDQTIMDIAGHVSHQMLGRYSHIRMEAKRRALESITKKDRASSQP